MLRTLVTFVKGGLPETSSFHNSASSGRTASGKNVVVALTSGLPKTINFGIVAQNGDAKNLDIGFRIGYHELQAGGFAPPRQSRS